MKAPHDRFPGLRTIGIAAMAALVFLSAPASLPFGASADDQASDSAVRFYFSLPFVAANEKAEPRLGFQVLTEIDGEGDNTPVPHELNMYTTLDLGFTLDGLAKLDVAGKDMRSIYEKFAHAIGLTPEEVELCRDSDCLDWVKPEASTTVVGAGRLQ